jgi:inner membrane protein
MFKTHLMFSLLVSLIIFKYFNLNPLIFILIFILTAILPDIDHAKSKIGRKFFIFSWIINLFFGHRKLIHSILFAGFLALIIKLLFNNYFIPFFLGYLSHLFLDILTKQGLKIFYPFKFQIKGFIRTNSLIEKLFLLILIVLNVYYVIKLIY